MSFLPLSINILITVLIVFIIVALKESRENEEESSENYESFLIELKTRFKKVIFITKPKSILDYLDSLFFFLLQIFLILIIISVTYGVIQGFVNRDPTLYDDRVFLIFAFSLWFIIIDSFLEKSFLKSKLISDKKVYKIISLLIFLLAIITLINFAKAYKVESGNALYNVEFHINNKKIKTNTENIYVGMTQEYLFIRNISKNSNTVYKRNDLFDFSIKKISHIKKKK